MQPLRETLLVGDEVRGGGLTNVVIGVFIAAASFVILYADEWLKARAELAKQALGERSVGVQRELRGARGFVLSRVQRRRAVGKRVWGDGSPSGRERDLTRKKEKIEMCDSREINLF